jgi:hypothetical protein
MSKRVGDSDSGSILPRPWIAETDPSKTGAPRGFLAKLIKADGNVTDHTGQLPPE